MSPPDRWTLADVAAHYARHPELRRTEAAEVPLPQPTGGAREPLAPIRVLGRGKPSGLLEASRRHKQASLAARVALVAWRATLAALPPVAALCGACDTLLGLKPRSFLGSPHPALSQATGLEGLAGIPASTHTPLTTDTICRSRSTLLRSLSVSTFTWQTACHNALVEVSKNEWTARCSLNRLVCPRAFRLCTTHRKSILHSPEEEKHFSRMESL